MLALWIIWFVLTLFVLSLAIARKIAARHETDLLHLSTGAEQAISEQTSLAQKLEKFDHWGKTLTVVDLLLGLLIVSIALFTAWRESVAIGN